MNFTARSTCELKAVLFKLKAVEGKMKFITTKLKIIDFSLLVVLKQSKYFEKCTNH